MGKITSESACDEGTAITFPAAPDGNLTDITIIITWSRDLWGIPRLPGTYRRLAIDGNVVAWETDSGASYVQLWPNTIRIKKSAWQTSISKTASFISEFREGEGFVITSAVQSCYTDHFDSALFGNSIADVQIGNVTADIQGYQDDASGTYTGTPNALIDRPDHVFKHLCCEIIDVPSVDIDATAFNVAGTFFASNNYTFSLLINTPVLAETLLMKLALQCRSRFFVSPYGKAKLIVRQLSQAGVHSIVKNEIKRDSVSIQRSPTDDLINFFNIRYNKNHAIETRHYDMEPGEGREYENYKAIKQFSDSTSITKYGKQEWHGAGDIFLFDAVTSDAMVQHVGDFLLSYHAVIRKMPNFAVFLDNMEVEPGDIIDITHPLDSMSNFTCEVLKTIHTLGSGRKKIVDNIKIIAIEN